MKKILERVSRKGYVAHSSGVIFSILLLFSFWESVWYALFFISVAIGVILLIKYKPYRGNWFKNWEGEPRRDLTFGIMWGLFVGSIVLMLNYKSQSFFSTAVGIVGLSVVIVLFVKCLENHLSNKKGDLEL